MGREGGRKAQEENLALVCQWKEEMEAEEANLEMVAVQMGGGYGKWLVYRGGASQETLMQHLWRLHLSILKLPPTTDLFLLPLGLKEHGFWDLLETGDSGWSQSRGQVLGPLLQPEP